MQYSESTHQRSKYGGRLEEASPNPLDSAQHQDDR